MLSFTLQILKLFSFNFFIVLPPPPFQSTPHARSNQATSLHSNRANGSDDAFFTLHQSHGTSSAALLHSLCEKVERQSQVFPFINFIKLTSNKNEKEQEKLNLTRTVLSTGIYYII